MKKLIIFLLVLSFLILPTRAYSGNLDLTWPTPKILKPGETTTEIVFIYTEDDFAQLLWLEAYYKIMEKKWVAKEEVYSDAMKELAKKGKIPFLKSFKCGFLTGIGLILISAIILGQIK